MATTIECDGRPEHSLGNINEQRSGEIIKLSSLHIPFGKEGKNWDATEVAYRVQEGRDLYDASFIFYGPLPSSDLKHASFSYNATFASDNLSEFPEAQVLEARRSGQDFRFSFNREAVRLEEMLESIPQAERKVLAKKCKHKLPLLLRGWLENVMDF